MSRTVRALAALTLPALCLACGGAGEIPAPAAAAEVGPLLVERGDFQRRLLLTGELRAESGEVITVPRTPNWQVEIRWLAEDGEEVKAGEKIVEFDNSSFTADLEDKRLQASEAANELLRRRAEVATQEAERAFQVERARTEVAKARIQASVPDDLLARREWEERQLELTKAELELAKAEEEQESQRVAAQAELGEQRVKLERVEREIAVAEEAIQALTVTAPVDGVVVVEDHPWNGRKLQEGDTVFVGSTVLRLPDLEAMTVEAGLSDVDDGLLAEGDRVVATVDAYPEEPFAGRVVRVSAIAREEPGQSQRRFFWVVVEPEGLDTRRMLPGMSVKIEALIDERHDVLVAPRAGLDMAAQPPRARLAGGGETEVELGPCNAQVCVVEAGLSAGMTLAGEAG